MALFLAQPVHTIYHNAACCYRCSAVCVFAGQKRVPCETGRTDRDVVWGGRGLIEPCANLCGSRIPPPHRNGHRHSWLYSQRAAAIRPLATSTVATCYCCYSSTKNCITQRATPAFSLSRRPHSRWQQQRPLRDLELLVLRNIRRRLE